MERTIKIAVLALGAILAVAMVYGVAQFKFDRLTSGAETDILEGMTAKQRQRQLNCLALNIYREAGAEPFEGKVAVAQVTLNRAENPEFPHDICGVVYQKTQVASKIICQFSWYCDADHRTRPVHPAAYAESMEVAKQVLLEGFRLPSLGDALYYHADYVNPRWNLEKIGKIGQHIFYRERT